MWVKSGRLRIGYTYKTCRWSTDKHDDHHVVHAIFSILKKQSEGAKISTLPLHIHHVCLPLLHRLTQIKDEKTMGKLLKIHSCFGYDASFDLHILLPGIKTLSICSTTLWTAVNYPICIHLFIPSHFGRAWHHTMSLRSMTNRNWYLKCIELLSITYTLWARASPPPPLLPLYLSLSLASLLVHNLI